MCGRYELHTPVVEIARVFRARPDPELEGLGAHYNVAPTARVPVVRRVEDGRRLEAMVWGLLPGWAHDASGVRPINARAETVFDKPMFRNAIRRRRCLVPADGFYEWQQRPGGKQPYHVGMADGGIFAMAGIWEYWRIAGAEPVVSCALLVTAANDLMRPIHDRMPVLIAPQDYATWLDPGLDDRLAIGRMLTPFPSLRMRAHPVSTRVNNVKNDDRELIEPLRT
jgi:putative SOS response-associated peptidase YedK